MSYDWRFENSINTGTKPIEVDKDYSKWRTNSVLSNHVDTILYSNEMNKNFHVTDQMHYDYLFHALRKKKRFSKGETKAEKKQREQEHERIALVSEFYKYNTTRAKEALSILTEDQIEWIKNKNNKGGVA